MPEIENLPFQETGIWRLDERHDGRCILADDMGLGKTMQSARASKPYRHGAPGIIVCPGTVKWSWQSQLKKFINEDSWVIEGRYSKKRVLPKYPPPYIILNWEILDSWADILKQSYDPQLVIPDEIHYAKNAGTKRTNALLRLCKDVPFIFPLSGTPIENGPMEFFVVLHLLWPKEFPSRKQFGMRYTNPIHTPWGIKYQGARRMKELNRRIKELGWVRRMRIDVADQLPPLRRNVIPIKLRRMKEYKEAEQNTAVEWKKFKAQKGEKVKKQLVLEAMQRLQALLMIAADLKVEHVIEWIDEFRAESKEKLCVYAHNRDILQRLHDHYKDSSVMYRGGMSPKKKLAAVNTFRKDDKCQLFFGSILAAGTGLDGLQEVCSKILIVQLYWVPGKFLQLEGRLWRLGQMKPVDVWYMIAKGTKEEKVGKAIHVKQGVLNQVLDGRFDDQQEFDFLKRMIKSL